MSFSIKDSVVILDDSSFVTGRIKKSKFSGPGIMFVYAPWCPFCKQKVTTMKVLGTCFASKDQAVYVLNGDVNRITSKYLGVDAFPTYYSIDELGYVKHKIQDATSLKNLVEACPGVSLS